MNVPILDLQQQYAALKPELDAALLRVAESQVLALGPEVEAFEQEIADYLGVKHALGVSSGTDALLLALMALGVGPGDEVIVPTFSFFATAGVVSRLNAVPVFVDIDPVTFCMDPEQFRAKISDKTKAVMPVHLYGQVAAMREINAIAAEHGITVVEDAAQSIGAMYDDGRRAGALGKVAGFSFYPTKNLGAFGDAGLVTCDDDDLYYMLKIMRIHGGEQRYVHRVVGGNFRMDALQGAVLRIKLQHLDAWTDRVIELAGMYSQLIIKAGLAEEEGLTDFDANNRVLLPAAVHRDSGVRHFHVYHQYVLRVQQRDELIGFLRERSVGAGVYYPIPFHRQECFQDLPSSRDAYPVSDHAAEHVLALPIYPEMSEEQLRFVVDSIAAFYDRA